MTTFTIITPVRNGAKFIRHCIESVKSQALVSQHIIIDGNSNDRTIEIIQQDRWQKVLLVNGNHEGIYAAINKGIKIADGDIIGILNSDDVYADPKVLSKVADVLQNTQYDSCYGDLVYVDRKTSKRIIRYWQSGKYRRKNFYFGWMPPHPTFFVRRHIYQKHGLFNLSLGSSADYELMLRLLFKNRISTCYIPEILVRMRIGGISSASFRNRICANLNDRKAWRENKIKPLPGTLYLKPIRKVSQYFKRP